LKGNELKNSTTLNIKNNVNNQINIKKLSTSVNNKEQKNLSQNSNFKNNNRDAQHNTTSNNNNVANISIQVNSLQKNVSEEYSPSTNTPTLQTPGKISKFKNRLNSARDELHFLDS
jgi:hypothetical protein